MVCMSVCWHKRCMRSLSPAEQNEAMRHCVRLLKSFMHNEESYTESLYGPLGLAEEVKAFFATMRIKRS